MTQQTTRYVFYTGIGANKTSRHSVNSFLAIVNKHFMKPELYGEEIKNYKLKDWIKFTGAELRKRPSRPAK